jgi:aryl-alcohol dehydrogenase-like predicted oxidoreductase
VLPVCEKFGVAVIPWSPLAGGWLTGRFRKGQEAPKSNRASRIPSRYDLSSPENQIKLEAVEQLALLAEDAGISMIDMALGFVLAHPAVTSPIIGPRTMEQLESQLGAAETPLATDVLDRIDEIVPPGRTLNRADSGWDPPALVNKRLRRKR